MDPAWPLVERQPELRRIADAWRRPGLRALVVDGPAGVGKTRLAREAVGRAQGQGVAVRWVVATRAAQGLPFAAVANLLPDAHVSAADPAVLLTAARQSLTQATGGRRVLLGVDDAHLLDDARPSPSSTTWSRPGWCSCCAPSAAARPCPTRSPASCAPARGRASRSARCRSQR